MLEDISEPRRLQKERERLGQQRAEVLNALRDGFFAVDSAWRVVLVNQPFEHMTGLARAELLGASFWELFPRAADPALPYERSYRQAMERREDVSFSGQLSRGAWLEIRCSPTADGGLAVFCRDVSEQRRADATLAQQALELSRLLQDAQAASKRAENANRTKDEFLATASHELRTPLNAILGWAQLLRLGQLDDSSARRASETIERNARSQVRLIEDILDGSRIITGKLQLEVRSLDLTALVRASLDTVRTAADAKQIELSMTLDPEAARVTGDPERLQQVLWNLVNNAIKFTPKGGSVSLSLKREGTSVELAVADSGQGIEPAFLPRVFERFSQAEGSSTRRHGGLGLGLALVRHLIEAHGGTVSAESAGRGQGARFVVRLPVRAVYERLPESERSSPIASPPSSLPSISLAGITALVVDDEADSRELVATVLRASGALVIAASSAAAAIRALSESQPHVLISDVGMPEVDGYTLIRQVRLHAASAEALPAVALTAYSRDKDRRKALEAGFQAHVSKPVEPADLVRVVASLLDRGAAGPG
jgi:PAS domain S-box-containing protein